MRLADTAEGAALGVLPHLLLDPGDRQVVAPGAPVGLETRVRRGDVRSGPGPRGGHGVGRHLGGFTSEPGVGSVFTTSAGLLDRLDVPLTRVSRPES
jgi:hypothetical protein